MPNYDILSDIWMDINGEPEIGPDGDFLRSEGTDALLQSCMFRLKTVIGDWVLEPECGASLEQLIGEPNSKDTGDLMEQLIVVALTHDGFLTSEEIKIVTIPVDKFTIMSTIILTYGGEQSTLAVALDLKEGKIRQLS
jgi:hypothetical protein